MSLPIINDLYQEVRRLSIAGARLSRDDFRLKNVLNDLEKVKGSSAVMQRLHATGTKVLESSDAEIGQNFLEFSNLVTAVMATQANTQPAGESRPLTTCPLGGSSEVSYRRLVPVIEALTRSGAGRTRIIQEYLLSGLPVDMRLVDPLLGSLGGYPEVAELAVELLKKANPGVLPLIKESFNVKGHKADARKLLLIHSFAGDAERDLYVQALNDGSQEVQESAIGILEQSREGKNILKDHRKQQKNADSKDEDSKGGIFNLKKLFKK
jgi:hypothetical protein